MVTVTINRNDYGEINYFCSSGHAHFDEYGSDIVCAAVSAILQTAVFGIIENLGLEDILVKTEDGWLICDLEDYSSNDDVKLILEVMVTGLMKTEESYPDNLKVVEGGKKDA
ncbi:ribosomal-processing cysteine protease Prp [Selenihalanaerobacter shriftii]|uniref:Ribosomal processing cysteine protease Prp n=1 Tax=Selenihalanaerobacter shriftii TaxID=142842 RepID=A0A1T4PNU4_9FIRM|nr:ribosomal-processing cysteine protease Prp [Selenihalanaerobacter shriftii]SJZ93001.1 hypothetical protein SAMN02745118_02241 [Selenihalanaerobacter shriftii]